MSGRVKGWCPGALRPMESGDGLVLRIRPHAGRLTPEAAQAIAALAARHGNGAIDLGSRAHLQIRGLTAEGIAPVQAGLAALGLLDPGAEAEARRNILTTPFWQADDGTLALVAELEAALREGPLLPAKFGFAVDTGARAVLGGASADIRIERGTAGLILRADGMAAGEGVSPGAAVPRAMDLARWFIAAGGAEARRMARLLASGCGHPPLRADCAPLRADPPAPGALSGPGGLEGGLEGGGFLVALPFGRIMAADLAALATVPIRLTPWRALLLEGVGSLADHPALITRPGDPRLRVAACPGAPACTSGEGETRALALGLAPIVPQGRVLHVSGCAKGCAHPAPADAVLTARPGGRYDLAQGAKAGADPIRAGLTKDEITEILRGTLAPPL